MPPGTDPQLMLKLAAELKRVLAAQARQANARTTAYFAPSRVNDGLDAVLSWLYFHPGDYNQDGVVNLGDLAPLGMHYGQAQGGANWAQHEVADGNADGLTSLADVAPIGIHWHKQLQSYRIESAAAADGPWTTVGTLARSAGLLPLEGGLGHYEFRITGGAATAFFRAYGDDAAAGTPRVQQLHAARHFMYQLQGLEEPGAVEALSTTHYDALVIEPSNTVQGSEDFDAKAMLDALRASADSQGGNKLVLAYLDIGQAEDYRTYWQADWVAPTATQRGVPDFLITIDPSGWSGDYPVAFWDPRWQAIVVDNSDSLLHQAQNAGFDGIYMDWVEAYSNEQVALVALADGVDPAAAMVQFIGHLREVARQSDPQFLVLQQNAPELLHDATGLADVIDGLALEDIWFYGQADAPWGDPNGGDFPQETTGDSSTAAMIAQAQEFQSLGLPVWCIDYCLQADNAVQVYTDSQALGFVPLVTQVSLSQLTLTSPPWY